ncbi:MAG: DUF4286 family protein [Tannerellaceae bacterium]|jgi:hypothetical protein|nr:DUF4286 family protein [Tannerellaceae bacterium]
MIVYNTTYHIDKEILEEALAYLKKIYIPTIITDGILTEPSLMRVMHDIDGGENYAVQFYTTDIDTLNTWLDNGGRSILQAFAARFGNKIVGFITLMEVMDWDEDE